MGRLSYGATASLDGFVADHAGSLEWAGPDDPEVFDAHLQRVSGTSVEVLGRRTYEVMTVWERPTPEFEASWTPAQREFARVWSAVDKVVVSSTLSAEDLLPGPVRLVPDLTPDEVRAIVAEAPGTVEVFGPTTAAPLLRAGVVDVVHLFVVPTVLGGGLPLLPPGVRLDLVLESGRVFANGTVHLQYRRSEA